MLWLNSLELHPEPRGKSPDISITEADVTATASAATSHSPVPDR